MPSISTPKREAMLYEPIWVESNDQKEAARALEMLHVQLISAVIDPYAWKWVLLTLQHALHAFMVASLAIQDAAPNPTVRECGPALRVQPHAGEDETESPRVELAAAYERMRRATGFVAGDDVAEDVRRLDAYCAALFGRIPERWTLRVNELPRLTQNCLRVVEHLGWNPGYIGWKKENLTDLARVKYLASIKVLEALRGQYHIEA